MVWQMVRAWAASVLLLVALGELGWWSFLHLRQATKERHQALAATQREAHLAEAMWRWRRDDGLALGLSPQAAQKRAHEALAPMFPALSFVHGEKVAPRVDVTLQIERTFRRRVRMFVAEAAAFCFVLLGGALLVGRASRQEQLTARQSANFLAAVTHELKSPLTSVKLWLQTLSRRPPSPQTLRHALATMQSDIDRLDTLIGNVLSASRLQAAPKARAGIERAQVLTELSSLIDDVVGRLRHVAEQKNIAIRWQRPSAALIARMEPAEAQLVLRNLLDNAIKYSPPGARVWVRLFDEEGVRIEVGDTGIGLSASDAKRVFERFFRVGDEMVRQSTGTGLGLFLVRQTVEAIGGRVWVRSAGPMQGCVFTVQLPSVEGAA